MSAEEDHDQQMQEYFEHAKEELIPKVASSAVGISLVPSDPAKIDPKFCMELGVMIMLDKPIYAVVTPGSTPPEHLIRVADGIIEADITTDAGRRSLATRLTEIVKE